MDGAAVTPEVSPSPASSPVYQESHSDRVTPAEAKQLLKEFQRAQKSEYRAVEHRQKSELNELKASQNARFKEWQKKEIESRHKFFADHDKGPEKRAYVQDFIARRKAFQQILADEKSRRTRESQGRLDALKEEQASRFREFKKALDEGKRPPLALWPDAGI